MQECPWNHLAGTSTLHVFGIVPCSIYIVIFGRVKLCLTCQQAIFKYTTKHVKKDQRQINIVANKIPGPEATPTINLITFCARVAYTRVRVHM